jgi:glycosyltransferase involved in cell wall biosynthesis
MLCASAYTAGDLAMLGSYLGRCFRWGYFPETKYYDDFSKVLEGKKNRSILWAGRLLDWKHPENAVEVAHWLKEEGYDFNLNIIGTGPMEESLQKQIADCELSEKVHLLGTMTPEQVRRHMEESEIFLFTSDQKEGWGAVLNESMNSGCAVVADGRIGSVPFLIQDGENGYAYNGIDELYARVKELLDQPETARKMGTAAYKTITEKWCAREAAMRLYTLCENLQNGKKIFEADGPCSKAPVCIKKRRK